MYENVKVEIVEQPETKSMRFRYTCEGPTAGSLLGVNSTDSEKTYPSIRILNYDGEAVVIASCVTIDKKPKPHPNLLIGKLCCRGVCRRDFTTESAAPTVMKFPQLGIRCPKKGEIVTNLEERKALQIDPFKTGFEHMHRPKMINLHQIRLCFQVLLKPDPKNPKHLIPLQPVVSDIIRDKHRTNMKLTIHDISDSSSPPCGGKKIMIFCDKVDKTDIAIHFYEEGDGGTVLWEDWAHFKSTNVHKQVAIAFRTPKYKVQDIDRPVNVFFRLQTMSDGTISNAMPFYYVPDVNNIELTTANKKRKIDNSQVLYDYLETQEADNRQRSKMTRNIHPNEDCVENNSPGNYNFAASNFYTGNDNLPVPQHSQHYTNNQPEKPFQTEKSNYQWPLSQLPQPSKLQEIYHPKEFEKSQNEQLPYYQQQCQTISQPQFNVESNYGNYSSPAVYPSNYNSEFSNVYGAVANVNSNDINNCGIQSQPVGNYPSPIVDNYPIQMTYDAPNHHSCQQIGPVYTTEKVIIQQFCNNNLTFNQQPQNVAETRNVIQCKN